MQGGSILAVSPSFNSYSSTRFAEIAAKVSNEFSDQKEELGLEACFVEESLSKESDPGFFSQEDGKTEQLKQERKDEEEKTNEIEEEDDEEEDDDDEFEFATVAKDTESSPISADEIFYNGQIKPMYPVFDRNLLFAAEYEKKDEKQKESASNLRFPLRKLLIEDRDPPSSSSSEADELETLPEGTYCVWTPKPVQASPERCKKSNSTGSSKRWRFRDFLHRSNSDGKDTFVFLAPKKREEKGENVEKSERRNLGETTKVAGKLKGKKVSGESSAHEIHYIRNRAMKEGDRRRSYLPYRQDLVGLFANVNGLSRNLHPF